MRTSCRDRDQISGGFVAIGCLVNTSAEKRTGTRAFREMFLGVHAPSRAVFRSLAEHWRVLENRTGVVIGGRAPLTGEGAG